MVWPKNALPSSGARLAGDDVHHGGLAGPVGSDHAAQFAHSDVERQLVERPEAVEGHRNVFHVQDAAVRDVEALVHHVPIAGAAGRTVVLALGPRA